MSKRSLGLGLAFAALLLLIWWVPRRLDPFAQRPFTPKGWRTADNGLGDNPRGRMARDLVERYLVPNMARVKVRELLGTPDERSEATGQANDYTQGHAGVREVYHYHLGFCTDPMRMDVDYLDIGFNRQGRLVYTWIHGS